MALYAIINVILRIDNHMDSLNLKNKNDALRILTGTKISIRDQLSYGGGGETRRSAAEFLGGGAGRNRRRPRPCFAVRMEIWSARTKILQMIHVSIYFSCFFAFRIVFSSLCKCLHTF